MTDYKDLNSRIARRVFVIYMMRKLRDPFIGSFFVLGISMAAIFSAVHAFDVMANALQLPSLIDSAWYMARAAVSTETSTQLVLAVALAAFVYLASRALARSTKVVAHGVTRTLAGSRKVAGSIANRIVVG